MYLILVTLLVITVHCLKMVPERANITYISPKYVENASLFITRYGRRSPYYLNVIGLTKQPWYNNVTLNFLFYEYLHNEYKRSFVEVHFKFCDMMNSDPYIGGMLLKHGLKCPLTPQVYNIRNMSASLDKFPNAWPIQKCRIDVDVTITDTKESLGRGYIFATFKDNAASNH